ncbi:MAG TPA: hypothetical protein VMF89_07445 [Polyangiales bacterium]|nr:hypothetical protein [Polyangiales bacterium]
MPAPRARAAAEAVAAVREQAEASQSAFAKATKWVKAKLAR